MLHSGILFDAVALPYELLARHPVWERHCAQRAPLGPGVWGAIIRWRCCTGPDRAKWSIHRDIITLGQRARVAPIRLTLRLRLAYIAAKFGSATATSYRAFQEAGNALALD
jgi:hypothetical protein